MSKKVLFSLILVAVMLLSGCSLELKDAAVDAKQTVIEVNGVHVTKDNFLNTYNYNLSYEQYYAQMMAQFGLSDGSVDESSVLQTTVNSYINGLVLQQKAEELGFDQFTDEETAELTAEAQEEFDSQLESIKNTYFADSELEGEELDAAVKEYAESVGYTLDYFITSEKSTHTSNRVRASVTDLVTITDDDISAALAQKIADEKSSYESSLATWGKNANAGTTTYYTPAGYRTVKYIEVKKPAADENGNVDTTETLAEITELAARIASGESIDALGAEVKEAYVCSASTDIDSAVVSAVTELADKEAYTDVIETEKSYFIAQYVDDVAEHEATLEEARDLLYDEVLSAAQDDAYDAAFTEWVNASDIKLNLDRLN
ncbi:MAG: SurA N-terminal domain-containing protein [Clostridia bacterium]|nr:SurA N-terminal domain-containing protein [Clostridia bacterium]MBR5382418.1 SurA N-terminal domain-containing protein [Clostridia bacterium]